ncbi:MAG: DUF2255 family protein [Dermatophilus congolensis]|nr:DUF2255 family protein [Dermatophilus congolensis]
MSTWSSTEHRAATSPEEVHVVTRRRDGSLRNPRIIWVVPVGDRVFIRSTNGRGADWFRWALATGTGQLLAGDTAYDVTFEETSAADLDAVDAAYRSKYGRYKSIVDHLVGPDPRAATLELLRA